MSSTINIYTNLIKHKRRNHAVWAFLRSGKNQCEIRAKHKNVGEILICPKKFFVTLRKLRDVRKNLCVCRKVFGMSGNFFWYMSGKFCRIFVDMSGEIFLGMSRKKFR
jgi:hypothetical protein